MRALALTTERARALGRISILPPSPGPLPGPPHGAADGRRRCGIRPDRRGGNLAALRHRGRFSTGKGETKVVALKDGSVVTLNTASEIRVNYSDAVRAVELVRGEALFDVAKNKARPFVVAAGDTSVRVVGTSFTVRHFDAAPVQVLVREGIVEVFKPAAGDAAGARHRQQHGGGGVR